MSLTDTVYLHNPDDLGESRFLCAKLLGIDYRTCAVAFFRNPSYGNRKLHHNLPQLYSTAFSR
jgi:hypothetical protein